MNRIKATLLRGPLRPGIPCKEDDKSIMALSLGIILLNVLFFTMAFSTITLIAGGSVSTIHFPLAIISSFAFNCWLFRQNRNQFWGVAAAGILILLLCLFVSGYVYDWSCDGNTYHKGITGALCWGWNPLKESYFKFSEQFDFLSCYSSPWLDAYAKASELYGACVYIFTRNIEMGKSYNLLAIFSLFFIAYGFFSDTGLLNHWQSFICAVFFALNPVSFSQIFTFYNDAFLGVMLFICLIGLLYVTFYPGRDLSVPSLYLIFVSINIGMNIKASSIVFFAVLCFIFFAFWIWRSCRNERSELYKRFCVLAASVLSGLFVLGSITYVSNTIRYKNPLYPMIGPGSVDILSGNLPQVYLTMNKPSQFIASLFSHTSNEVQVKTVNWKIPFTFTKREIQIASVYDTRTAGWGILFSGIFLLSILVIAFGLWKFRKEKNQHDLILVLLLMMALEITVIPALSWARYFTFLFCVPVVALMFLFVFSNRHKKVKAQIFALFLSVLLGANMLPNVKRSLSLMKHAKEPRDQLVELQTLSNTERIIVGNKVGEFPYVGRFFNVIDAGISNFEYEEIEPEEALGKVFGNFGLYYKIVDNTDRE